MLKKINGIVLQVIRHSDSTIIAHILTQEYGLAPFIIHGIHNKKKSTRSAYFQPLTIITAEIYYKPSRDMQSVKEVSAAQTFKRIPLDFTRSSIAFFLGEVLKKSLNEYEANATLYDYVTSGIMWLDSQENIVNFHLGFLIGLSSYLGIAPAKNYDDDHPYFDMQAGMFNSSKPLHGYYMDKYFSGLLFRFVSSTFEELKEINLKGSTRSAFLDILLTYYGMHLQGLKKINSLDVMKELFR